MRHYGLFSKNPRDWLKHMEKQKEKSKGIIRLTASNSGETKCIVFVDSLLKARQSLEPHVNTVVAHYPFIGAFGVHCSVHKLTDLATLPCVKAIAPHTTVFTCIKDAKTLLHIPEFNQKIGYGKGITCAVIDTGLNPHIDLILGKKVIFKDFIGGKKMPYDDNGHGTAVASILCGNGLLSNGENAGIAPVTDLVVLKAIGGAGEGGAFAILEAMQWIFDNAETLKIKVVCMSFGSEPVADGVDPLSIGAEALWKKGIVVVTSAGNDGPSENTIKSPGINPYVITVGGVDCEQGTGCMMQGVGAVIDRTNNNNHTIALSTFKGDCPPCDMDCTAEQSGTGSLFLEQQLSSHNNNIHKKKCLSPLRYDNPITIAEFSSRGPAGKFNKPDIVAPAVDIVTAGIDQNYITQTGTSMAAPIVAGSIALLLSKKPNLTPDRIKELLLNSATPLPYPKTHCGAGLLNLAFLEEIKL